MEGCGKRVSGVMCGVVVVVMGLDGVILVMVMFEKKDLLSEMVFELVNLFVSDLVSEIVVFGLDLGEGELVLFAKRPVHSILKL